MLSFDQVMATVGPHPCYAPDQMHFLYQALQATNALPGDVAELGVYQGCTAGLIARCCAERTIWLFDSFEGMLQTHEIDVVKVGQFTETSLAAVQQRLAGLNNVRYVQGWFPASIQGRSDLPKSLAFAHIDLDLYESTRDAIAFVWPRLAVGGMIVFHDWLWPDCPGVKRAVDEFFGQAPIKYAAQEGRYVLAVQKKEGLVAAW